VKHRVFAPDGTLLAERDMPVSPAALSEAGVAATLNAVLGVWPLTDAANAVGLLPEDLVAEAEGWAVAAGIPVGAPARVGRFRSWWRRRGTTDLEGQEAAS
jgi:hypothetical protein